MRGQWRLAEGVTATLDGTTLTGSWQAVDLRFEFREAEGQPDLVANLADTDLHYLAVMSAGVVSALADFPISLCITPKFEVLVQKLAERVGIAPPPEADGPGPSAEAVAMLGELSIQTDRVLELSGPRCKVRMELKGPGTNLQELDSHELSHLHWLVCLYAWQVLAAVQEQNLLEFLPVIMEVCYVLAMESTNLLGLAGSPGVVMIRVPMDALDDEDGFGALDDELGFPEMDSLGGDPLGLDDDPGPGVQMIVHPFGLPGAHWN